MFPSLGKWLTYRGWLLCIRGRSIKISVRYKPRHVASVVARRQRAIATLEANQKRSLSNLALSASTFRQFTPISCMKRCFRKSSQTLFTWRLFCTSARCMSASERAFHLAIPKKSRSYQDLRSRPMQREYGLVMLHHGYQPCSSNH